MQIQLSIDNIIAALITEFAKAYIPDRILLGIGNIYQVGIIQTLHQDANMYIQLAYEGSSDFRYYDGTVWARDWLLGVGIFIATEMDIIDQNTQAAKDILTVSKACSEVIAFFDDFDDTLGAGAVVSTAEPVEQTMESGIDLLSINDHEYLVIRQQYRLIGQPYDLTDFKGLN